MDIEKLRNAWPHVRTVLIFLHVLAVIALSLPTPYAVSSRKSWQNPNMQQDLQQWSERLEWLGYDNKGELEDDLWALSQGYLRLRRQFIRPFQIYSKYSGTRQGWRMFSNPRIEAAPIHIDIYRDGAWQPVYRPFSDEYDFRGDTLRHNRFRKLLGRTESKKRRALYEQVAGFLAGWTARAFPDAIKVRVRQYRYFTLPPEDVRAGREPDGKYERVREYDAEALR